MTEQAFLLKYVRYAYNQRGPFYTYVVNDIRHERILSADLSTCPPT